MRSENKSLLSKDVDGSKLSKSQKKRLRKKLKNSNSNIVEEDSPPSSPGLELDDEEVQVWKLDTFSMLSGNSNFMKQCRFDFNFGSSF